MVIVYIDRLNGVRSVKNGIYIFKKYKHTRLCETTSKSCALNHVLYILYTRIISFRYMYTADCVIVLQRLRHFYRDASPVFMT